MRNIEILAEKNETEFQSRIEWNLIFQGRKEKRNEDCSSKKENNLCISLTAWTVSCT